MRDLRQVKQYADYMRSLGWEVERSKEGVFAYVRKLPGLPFSLMKVQRVPSHLLDCKWLKRVARQHRVIQQIVELERENEKGELRAEERRELGRNGYREISRGMLPTKTIWIDLEKSFEQMEKEMKPKVRYNGRLARKRGIKIKVFEPIEVERDQRDFSQLKELLRISARRKKYWMVTDKWLKQLLKAFGKQGMVVVATYEEKWIAAAIFLQTQEGAYYSYNGATDLARKWMAPTLIILEAIELLKSRGLMFLDMDGVWDERYPSQYKRWKGFSRFKETFGGEARYYPKAWQKWFW